MPEHKGKFYALVDCNNFFVSCERVFRPELEGRPVVVLSNNDGCVVSRSNESKKMGIRMGTPYFRISDLAEKGELTVCSSNYTLYGDMSSRVMSILSEAVPELEIYSIDEAFLVLADMPVPEMTSLCSMLKEKVRKWTGIPVSIGLAPTRTLAKIASHFAKKYAGYGGVCVIDSEEKRIKALGLTPIGDVWGIGRRLAPKMNAMGISTAGDFVARPAEWVKEKFHVQGLKTYMELSGTACIGRDRDSSRKSICTSRSFAEMTDDEDVLSRKVADFAAQCSRKLREEGTAAGAVTVFLWTNRFREDLDQYFPSVTVHLPTAASNTQEIVSAALSAFRMIFREGYRYKKAGVIVGDIIPADAVPADIFDFDAEKRSRNDRISAIMDKVNPSGCSNLLRLGSQKPGHYASDIKSEHRSRQYSTSLDEIIEVR